MKAVPDGTPQIVSSVPDEFFDGDINAAALVALIATGGLGIESFVEKRPPSFPVRPVIRSASRTASPIAPRVHAGIHCANEIREIARAMEEDT